MGDPAFHQTGLIITKTDDGNYAYTMTSVGAALPAAQLQDLLQYFDHLDPTSLNEIDADIARDGHAVVGSPTKLSIEEEALCIC